MKVARAPNIIVSNLPCCHKHKFFQQGDGTFEDLEDGGRDGERSIETETEKEMNISRSSKSKQTLEYDAAHRNMPPNILLTLN